MRWLPDDVDPVQLEQAILPTQCIFATESFSGNHVLLLPAEWALRMFTDKNPDILVTAF